MRNNNTPAGTRNVSNNHDPQSAIRNPQSAIALVRSFAYAFAGIAYCLRTQRNFRIHILAAILVAIIGALLGLSWTEWAILALTVTLVLTAEMVNTVVEAAIDLASPTYHPLAKVAKDVAAGAVLLTAAGAVLVGACLFLPHILR